MNDPFGVQAGLNLLRKQFPNDTVSIWWTLHPGGEEFFTARLHENELVGLPNVYGNGCTLEKAIADVVVRAKERDPAKRKAARVAELKHQLAQLEGTP